MKNTKERLEYLRQQLRAECISMDELIELQSLASHIEKGDVELLEAAGVPEFNKMYRVTWRHEVYIEAKTPEEAKERWCGLNLGALNDEDVSHEFIERVSFEDEDYNDV